MTHAHHQFFRFRNGGKAFNGEALGARDGAGFWLNAVELTFKVTDSIAVSRYRDIKAYQWAGPEAIWLQIGDGTWMVHKSSQGSGEDPPLDDNRQTNLPTITYYDNPGIQIGMFQAFDARGATRIHVVQNFTGWVVGYPTSGGGAQQISDVQPWYSRVSLVKAAGKWSRDLGRSGTGTGWVIITQTP